MDERLILVTGATGYIASRLIPRLLERGLRVRALARNPQRLVGRGWARQVEIVAGDVLNPASLPATVEGVHTAYYLIHNMSIGHGYIEKERVGAQNFGRAARAAGVQHIIYLGGLADPEQDIAPHMRSRIETGYLLRQSGVPVTEFRAGVIVGAGSISFEMIRFMTELFPIVVGPRWLNHRSQPIAVQNVVDYLLAALDNPDGQGQVFEIGGADVLLYRDLMLTYAQERKLKRRLILLPYLPVWSMALIVSRMTPVPYPIAYALIEGLSADSIVKHPGAQQVFPKVKLMDFKTAAQEALANLHPDRVERVWEDGQSGNRQLKHEGFFVERYEGRWDRSSEGGRSLIGRYAQSYGWRIENSKTERDVLLHRVYPFGEEWEEWRFADGMYICTHFFAPHGVMGFVYWHLGLPVHRLIRWRFIRTGKSFPWWRSRQINAPKEGSSAR